MLGISGGAISAILTLGKKFESIDDKQQARLLSVDQRIDRLELGLAKDYVDKTDLQHVLERLDARIDKMDYKLDQILIGYNKALLQTDSVGIIKSPVAGVCACSSLRKCLALFLTKRSSPTVFFSWLLLVLDSVLKGRKSKVTWPPDGRTITFLFPPDRHWKSSSGLSSIRDLSKTLPSRLDRAERDWHAKQRDQLAEPELIEHEPDGSEAQSLLGGSLRGTP